MEEEKEKEKRLKTKMKESEKKKKIEEIREEIKFFSKSHELQKVQANEGEFIIHENIIELAREEGITVAVFRGIETYQKLGKVLEKFGFNFSKPKKA